METKEKVKSKLQIKVESEGWEFLTNEAISDYESDWDGSVVDKGSKRDDADIYMEFFNSGTYRGIKIEDAYDAKGNLLLSHRAVYVKR
jgi:hypothetical protein